MKSINRYEPERGFRFSTYAHWWIRAAIQTYVIKSVSVVRYGTTHAQRKLFYNLHRITAQLRVANGGNEPDVSLIAERLSVPESAIIEASARFTASDLSLDAPIGEAGDTTCQDLIATDMVDPEQTEIDRQTNDGRSAWLTTALTALTERERHILVERRLKDRPTTLDTLSRHYGVSRERIRQIEVAAYRKIESMAQKASTTTVFDCSD